jgi:serine acetyltransferase
VLQDGCNIEIGETAEIGKNVKIYNNVTIGSLG